MEGKKKVIVFGNFVEIVSLDEENESFVRKIYFIIFM